MDEGIFMHKQVVTVVCAGAVDADDASTSVPGVTSLGIQVRI